MDRIEKSVFRKGEYVGYAEGLVWHIRGLTGSWFAYAVGAPLLLSARTLKELNELLGEHDKRYDSSSTLTGSL